MKFITNLFKRKKRYFFIAYSFMNKTGNQGMGNRTVDTTDGNYFNRLSFDKFIAKEFGLDEGNVVVTNVIELSEKDHTTFQRIDILPE